MQSFFKGYYGFPASICASVNERGSRVSVKASKNGDIISIDIGAELNGYYGDAAVTLPVGEIDQEVERLLNVTKESLKGIEQAVIGNRLSDISHAIQTCRPTVLVWFAIMLGTDRQKYA